MALSYRQTELILGMLQRGDRQHDIAAYFGVNAGRIAEIAGGQLPYPSARPKDETELPPSGPYLTKFDLQSVIRTVNEAVEALELAEGRRECRGCQGSTCIGEGDTNREN
ncbi:hypothetical protein [Hoeflea sp.]|uniref:hypothetical protein n=1 Tax=Hoeflea sp. TaxID=1940281 RepID=UPI003B01334D